MSSLKQIEANRRNARKSTGPRTAIGKITSSRNALKSGIDANTETALPFENAEELAALAAEYYDRFAPATPEERCLVDSLVSDEWLLRRFRVIEGQILTHDYEDDLDPDPEQYSLGCTYGPNSARLDRLQRRINATRKSFLVALKALKELQAENRAAEAAAPERTPRKLPAAAAQPEPGQPLPLPIGFVPQPPPVPLDRRGGLTAHGRLVHTPLV